MKNLTSSFSIKQESKSTDLIVSINSKKEILFNNPKIEHDKVEKI